MSESRLGHYELLTEIGRGGMGRVYRARDTRLDREVALKVLHPDLVGDVSFRQRFEQEARSVARLNHPNIVTIYAVEEADGLPFLAMELVEGVPLNEHIRSGGLSLPALLDLILPVCDALGAAHAEGIVHCDLKPGNIMIDERGQVKVLDFGLARAAAPTGTAGSDDETIAIDSTRIAQTWDAGVLAGTLAYMSPEQLNAGPLGPASDVFSLGVLMFELATGERPFTGPTALRVAAAILGEAAPSLADRGGAAATLAPVIDRCLEKDPAQRFRSAEALREALTSLGCGDDPSRLAAARTAFADQDWHRAHALFSAIDAAEGLGGADLERFAEASYWLGSLEAMARIYERAFAAYTSEGRRARAGYAALLLAECSQMLSADAPAQGWLRRAERILAEFPDTPEYAYLLRFQAVNAIESERDYAQGIELAARVHELGRRHGDRDLVALAMQDRGRALIAQGKVAEGMALLDEVMAAAVAGELSPIVVGTSYCNMISSCHALADYRRAGEWSAAGVSWCEGHADTFFPGICRVYRAEVMRLRGAWAEADAELRQVCAAKVKQDTSAAAFYEIGEIRLRTGDEAGAEAAFRQAHQLGLDPLPGLAVLRLAQGRIEAASELLQRTLADASLTTLDRIRLLPVQVEVALAGGDLHAARLAVEELEAAVPPFASLVFTAFCEQARGHLQLAEGMLDEAAVTLGRSVRLWAKADLPYERARVRLLLAQAYLKGGKREAAELEAAAARSTFRRLGAKPDLLAAERLPGGSEGVEL